MKKLKILTLLAFLSLFGNAQQITQNFNFQGSTFQNYIVPTTGWYFMSANGAQGGPASNLSHKGGYGASVQCYIQFQAGDTLRIAVGGAGKQGQNNGNNPSGGGGGGSSTIVKVSGSTITPLLIAGGGGGGASSYDGSPGLISPYGGFGMAMLGQGGFNNGSYSYQAAGGGGFYFDGEALNNQVSIRQAGQAFLNGNLNGISGSYGGDGGWGGGASGGSAEGNNDGSGGGGGGFTGGDGGGGGGGSFLPNDTIHLQTFTYGLTQKDGSNLGDGSVTIAYTPDFEPPISFSFQGNVFQQFIAPATGWYLLDASGAQGGSSCYDDKFRLGGGPGARMQGYTKLQAGDTLRIAVGGEGNLAVRQDRTPTGAGGGGASSIVKVNGTSYIPLLIAGGGGGWGNGGNGGSGLAENSGGPGISFGGSGGSGGGGGSSNHTGGGGAGFYGDGGSHCDGNCNGTNLKAYGGQAYLSGNYGGYAGSSFGGSGIQGGAGGWGGGGQGGYWALFTGGGGGGGGGYSGGGGGGNDNGETAGGGGSFVSTYVDNYGCLAQSGANWRDGFVTIKYVPDYISRSKFGFQGNSFQRYIVPETGWYLLDASGAQGGPAGSHRGGRGARMQGYAKLNAGDTLQVAVGEIGRAGTNDGNNVSAGGGGGASSIVKISGSTYVPLVIAGGGGGAGSNYDGSPGLQTNQGGIASSTPGGLAGGGGNISDPKNGGAGGGGYYFDGTSCIKNDGTLNAYGGQSYLGGNYGGNSGRIGGNGGWGGGGEGGIAQSTIIFQSDGGGGGGGGYSGGSGAQAGDGAGGGGSYVSPDLNRIGCLAKSDANADYGFVTIKYLPNYSDSNSFVFVNQGNVFQSLKVPVTGFYYLDARGGEGGPSSGHFGGRGAIRRGYVYLLKSDSLQIAVGGNGGASFCSTIQNYDGGGNPVWSGGSGGGASSIVKISGTNYIPLVFAGGGGGATKSCDGGPGLVTEDGGGKEGYRGTNGSGGRSLGGTTGGGGYYSDGESWIDPSTNKVMSVGGQAYLNGNHGGEKPNIWTYNDPVPYGLPGGWGGGAEGSPGGDVENGAGGSGGGYSGGALINVAWDKLPVGGGGGSYLTPLGKTLGLTQLEGGNEGDGAVIVIGPRTSTDTVNSPGPYTWPANGITYNYSGSYVWVDSANAITRTLDLSITSLGAILCTNYTRVDTTVTFCGGFTWARNGRTYTTNMVDSVRIGCKRYIIRLFVAPPAAVGPIQGVSSGCRNTTATFSVEPIPFATRYQWTLPSGASGSSTTNTITVTFSNQFNGGQIKVAAVNSCGASAIQMKSVGRTLSPPAGRLNITGPSDRISGFYSVNALSNTTSYTWSVSNNQAVIVSGQGTSRIHLEALPGFSYANLSVVASNCKGNGSRGYKSLGTNGGNTCSGWTKIAETNEINDVLSVMPLSVSLFPNPSNSSFNLQVSSTDSKDVNVNIFDLQGRKIKSMKSTPNQNTVFGNDLKAGVYMIEVTQGNLVKTMRAVKY